jgi:hypothetical protein
LRSSGFELRSAHGGASEGFGDQRLVFSDGQTTVEVMRDRSQWSLTLHPRGWNEGHHLGALLAASRGQPQADSFPRPLPEQIPESVSWIDVLPGVLDWSVGFPHREVFVEAESRRWAAAAFGGRPPDLSRLEGWVRRLGEAIDAPERLLPTFGRSADLGRPHIESGRDALHYVVVERGEELTRQNTTDPNTLLEWVFEHVSFSMASTWELAHRNPEEDFRRLLFAKQLVLLDILHPRWAIALADHKRQRFAEVGLNPNDAAELVAAEGD